MVSLAGLPPANRAGLDSNEAEMVLVAGAARLHERKANGLIVRAGLAVLMFPWAGSTAAGAWELHTLLDNRPHDLDAAPEPGKLIVGAGLPVLVVGYGVYWVVKRQRRAGSQS